MIPIFVNATHPFTGRHFVSFGLGMRLRSAGLKVGHFKPFGLVPGGHAQAVFDEDAAYFCEALGIHDPPGDVCPFVITEDALNRILAEGPVSNREVVMGAFKRVSAGKDVMIIGGAGGLCGGSIAGFGLRQFIDDTQARLILVSRLDGVAETLDSLLAARDCFGASLKGVIFNRVSDNRLDYAAAKVKPFLEKQGIHVYGIVENDPELSAVSVGELVAHLHGKVLVGGDRLDLLIERYMIGAMNVDSAIRHFRKQRNKAVVTGGDRGDIQIAALETSTRCLVLTGGLYPPPAILSKAAEMGVPVVLVEGDTAVTIEKCDQIIGRHPLRMPARLKRAAEVFNARVDAVRLCSDCGVKLP